MKTKIKILTRVITIIILVGILFFVVNFYFSNSEHEIKRIIDGDTFVIESGEHIRMIGINSPEKGEFYYDNATDCLKDLILGKKIILESDVKNKDYFGRLLRYVYTKYGFVNLGMVERGCAAYYDPKPNNKYSEQFVDAENKSRELKLGMWAK